MIGLGTIVNTIAILAGGIIGSRFGQLLKPETQMALQHVNGVSVIFIAISGAMVGMLSIKDGALASRQEMLLVVCLALGTLIGELIGIENWFVKFGEWLKLKSGNVNDWKFVDSFLTASMTVSIGAMAVVGSIQDGINGEYSTLMVKSILDFITIMIMASSLGKGATFSAIPVFVFQGVMTIGARALEPVMTELAIANLSMVGSVLIFCVGINLLFDKGLRVTNMLPALIIAVIAAYI